MNERIAILGTGLIGGSLGLAWKHRRPGVTIVGHDRPEVLERAEARGAIDAKAAAPVTAVEDADVVVLCTPLATTLRMLDAIADAVTPGTIVTDVASVKQPVLDQAHDVLPDGVAFVGGHPMAGAEQSGIDHADALLFENAAYVLCLPDGASTGDLDGPLAPVVDLVESVGARPLVLDAATHDRVAAVVSHLPQLLAVALVNTVAETDVSRPESASSDVDERGDGRAGPPPEDATDADAPDAPNHTDNVALDLAAGGFRDMTRIASSPFSMWRDVLVGNESAIHDALSHFTRVVQHLRNRLIADDLDALEDAFDSARDTRRRIPRTPKGFLQPLHDVLVRAPDEPGVLHAMTGALSDAGINIRDIELQKFREGTGGTFRLGFESDDDAARAVDVLDATQFDARRTG